MFIEHRTYTLHPGNLPIYLDLLTHVGLPIQLKYLPCPLGYYNTELGALNQVIHLWGYESLDQRQELRARLKADPEWPDYVRQILPLIQNQESKILVPAGFYAPRAATYQLPCR